MFKITIIMGISSKICNNGDGDIFIKKYCMPYKRKNPK